LNLKGVKLVLFAEEDGAIYELWMGKRKQKKTNHRGHEGKTEVNREL